MDAFRKLYSDVNGTEHIVNNFRPTKALNGRTVYKSYEKKGLFRMFSFS